MAAPLLPTLPPLTPQLPLPAEDKKNSTQANVRPPIIFLGNDNQWHRFAIFKDGKEYQFKDPKIADEVEKVHIVQFKKWMKKMGKKNQECASAFNLFYDFKSKSMLFSSEEQSATQTIKVKSELREKYALDELAELIENAELELIPRAPRRSPDDTARARLEGDRGGHKLLSRFDESDAESCLTNFQQHYSHFEFLDSYNDKTLKSLTKRIKLKLKEKATKEKIFLATLKTDNPEETVYLFIDFRMKKMLAVTKENQPIPEALKPYVKELNATIRKKKAFKKFKLKYNQLSAVEQPFYRVALTRRMIESQSTKKLEKKELLQTLREEVLSTFEPTPVEEPSLFEKAKKFITRK